MVVLDNCALFEILRKSDRGRALQELLMVEEKGGFGSLCDKGLA